MRMEVDDLANSQTSPSDSPPRIHCAGPRAKQDHEELILSVLQRLGGKSFSLLKKLTKEPELANEEWEVDELLDIQADQDTGEDWLLLKWKDWPASFASWERPSAYNLDPRIIDEFRARKLKAENNSRSDAISTSDSELNDDVSNQKDADAKASKKRTISAEEMSDIARSVAKHVSWPAFIQMMKRLDNDNNLNLFKKGEAILREDLYIQHLSIPCGLNEVVSQVSRGIIARKRLEWKLSQLENVRVQIVNDVDEEAIPQLPPGFEYIVTNRYTASDISPDILESLVGCQCKSCVPGTRKCCSQQAGVSFAYRDDVPNTLIDHQRSQAIYECTSRCKCTPENCSNRVLQKGLTIPMQLFKTEGRGWGLKTLKPIRRGEFVIEYVGEVITSLQADEREGNQYLFDLDFNPEGDGQYTIDAMTLGNLARFINSRCGDANLISYAVYVDCQHPDLPRIGFFANRDIEAMEELTFDYMMQGGATGLELCLCGSSKCRGTMKLTSPNKNVEPEPEPEREPSQAKPKRAGGGRGRRRRGGRRGPAVPSEANDDEPETKNGDAETNGDILRAGSNNDQFFDLDNGDMIQDSGTGFLNPNADDVLMSNSLGATSKNDSIMLSSTADRIVSEEDGDIWHHANPNVMLDSPEKHLASPGQHSSGDFLFTSQRSVRAETPTHSSLFSEQQINGLDDSSLLGAKGNIDMLSEKSSSLSLKEDQNVLDGLSQDDKLLMLSTSEGRQVWENFAVNHRAYQTRNPFNDELYNAEHVKTPRDDKNCYGKPPAGSLTEQRGIKAHKHISSEIVGLCHVIKTTGTQLPDGTTRITFGQLFALYNKISNKLLGILLRARKYGFVDFPGEILYQRQDDHVVITLLSCPRELKLMYK